MITLSSKTCIGWLAGLAIAAGSLTAHAEEPTPIRIGWVHWSDTEIAVKLADTALREHLKQPGKLVLADIGIQFHSLAHGHIELIPMVWQIGRASWRESLGVWV